MDKLDSSQYDDLVAEYETSLALPSSRCTGVNFFANLGDVKGLRLLDLSIGTGIVARMVAKLGANKVVGVDTNGGMLGKAKGIIAADASVLKDVIEFELGDVFAPLNLSSADCGSFDVVAGIWSLNFAGNPAMMDQAFKNMAKSLKDGGRFSGWYGVGKKIIEEVKDGYQVRTIFLTNPPLEFENFDLEHSVYFKAAEGAGLKDIKTDAKEAIAPPFKNGEDQAYWDRYLERPLFGVITANK